MLHSSGNSIENGDSDSAISLNTSGYLSNKGAIIEYCSSSLERFTN